MLPDNIALRPRVAVVGGGPAGLMAADVLSAAGMHVTVYDRMPSLGRKLLMAGRGGLNLTHGEPLEAFLDRYGPARSWLEPVIRGFPPSTLVAFANGLGQETFTGTSGRIFPKVMKASPLLRAWLERLVARNVQFKLRHCWTGFADGAHVLQGVERSAIALTFDDAAGQRHIEAADAVILALGGASWPRLGSDGGWHSTLRAAGVQIAEFAPANAGVAIPWGAHIAEKFAGTPLKRIAVSCGDVRVRGEALVTRSGVEGNAIYTLNPAIRTHLASHLPAKLIVDFRPDMLRDEIVRKLGRRRPKDTVTNWLRKALSLAPVELAILREAFGAPLPPDPGTIAGLIKVAPISVTGFAGLDRAISAAGGITAAEIDTHFMLRRLPGVFLAGEMLDWEAPTGGYLLQACFATGHAAGQGALAYLADNSAAA